MRLETYLLTQKDSTNAIKLLVNLKTLAITLMVMSISHLTVEKKCTVKDQENALVEKRPTLTLALIPVNSVSLAVFLKMMYT